MLMNRRLHIGHDADGVVLPPPKLRGLDDLVGLADNGQYLPDLLQRNDQLVLAIQQFSQTYGAKAKGKLTITIDYEVDRFGQINLGVTDKVTRPTAPKAKAIAWTLDDGSLTVANPNQRAMQVRDLPDGRREFRTPDDN